MSVSWAHYLLPQLEETAVFEAYKKEFRSDATRERSSHANAHPGVRVPQPAPVRRQIEISIMTMSRRWCWARRRSATTPATPATNRIKARKTAISSASGIDKTKAGPIFSGSKFSARHIIDGLSSTLAVGERHIPPPPANEDPNMEHFEIGDTAFLSGDCLQTILCGTEKGLADGPDDVPIDEDDGEIDYPDDRFGSPHSGVVQFVYLDGHVDSLQTDIDTATLMGLSTHRRQRGFTALACPSTIGWFCRTLSPAPHPGEGPGRGVPRARSTGPTSCPRQP